MMNLHQRAALIIRSLTRQLRVSNHIVVVEGGPNVSTNGVLAELEAETKVGDGAGDAALAIGEHAFLAGYDRGYSAGQNGADSKPHEAWSDYDPPEDIKALS